MHEDAERCVRAVQSKDARFDGWFSTGSYAVQHLRLTGDHPVNQLPTADVVPAVRSA